MTFKDISLIEPILRALKETGYENPTPIQEKAIPAILSGRDLLGCAQTGTGKTAAFSIPILQLLHKSDNIKGIRALILTPTRELANQIGECFDAYEKYTGLKHTVIFGGVSQAAQIRALKSGVQVLIATPGRLLDLQSQGFISLKGLEFFVLDEVDRMLDMGFIHDIKRLLKLIPQKRQTLFFSATIPQEIKGLADSLLTNPIKVEVAPVSSTADIIEQSVYFVEKKDKIDLLLHVLQNPAIESLLVFTNSKHRADKITRILNKQEITAKAIHGNKSQNARESALKGFKNRDIRVLIATDIAARGIDVNQLSHVINFELPNVPETYVHRIGRTGRAGNEGVAVSFCETEEVPYLKSIQKLIKRTIPVIEEHPFVSECIDIASSITGTSAGAKTKNEIAGKQVANKKKTQPQNKERRSDKEKKSHRNVQSKTKQTTNETKNTGNFWRRKNQNQKSSSRMN